MYASDQLETDIIDEVLATEDDKIKLIYIDDFASSPQVQSETLHSLFFRSRHSNTSVIFTTQYYP